MIDPRNNMAVNLLATRGLKSTTATDDTYVVGATFDRLANASGTPMSMLAIAVAQFDWDTGSGAGDTNTLTLAVFHGDASNMSDEGSALDSDTYVYTWAADGVNSGQHQLPVDLSNAKRYIRIKAKLTAAHSPAIINQALALVAVFGGMDKIPSSSYAAAGYEETTEAA